MLEFPIEGLATAVGPLADSVDRLTATMNDLVDIAREPDVQEVRGREVHCDRNLQTFLPPGGGLGERLLEHRQRQGPHQIRLLDHRQKAQRKEQPADRMQPAQQCLHAEQSVARQVELRLILDGQLARSIAAGSSSSSPIRSRG